MKLDIKIEPHRWQRT